MIIIIKLLIYNSFIIHSFNFIFTYVTLILSIASLYFRSKKRRIV